MASNSINLGNKTLNYNSFKELFEELQKIEDIEKTTINISYSEKKKELKKEHSKTFNSISELLEYVKDLKKIDCIEVCFWYKNSRILLKYDNYYYSWKLEYTDENNVTNSIRFVLYNYFKPNLLKKIIFQTTFVLWGIWWVMLILSLVILGDVNVNTHLGHITLGVLLSVFACLISLTGYKYLKRTKPYINNKFWEEHKVDIIQNIIFYFLGVVTPYIITWVVAFIKN